MKKGLEQNPSYVSQSVGQAVSPSVRLLPEQKFNAISLSAPFVCLSFVFVVYCLLCPLEDVHPPPRELSTHDFFQPTSNGAICDESVRENLAGLLPKVRRLERDNLAGPLPKSSYVAGCRITLRISA